MLTGSHLDSLAQQLARACASILSNRSPMGRVEFVRKAAEEAEALFQQTSASLPSASAGREAVLACLDGVALDEDLRHLVAGALCLPVSQRPRKTLLGSSRLTELLRAYRRDAESGDLWMLTWFGLLSSYFAFDASTASKAEHTGWEELRSFLQHTWPLIDREAGTEVVPAWLTIIRQDPDLLGENAAYKYGLDFVRGDDVGVRALSRDVGIPESSWFWQVLVLSAVIRSAEQDDAHFKADIPKLIALIDERPVFRDEALEVLLTRYQKCARPELHKLLRDYVVRKDVWRNPKLRAAGLATAWNRVSDSVWRMVNHWVNEANLRDFFAILAARRDADGGRLDFWAAYLDQITETRLIFGAKTQALAASSEPIRNLIAREEGSYAVIASSMDVDAFMMQIGQYLIVEFSRQPNAAYIYESDALPFDQNAARYTGTTGDLKYGFGGECAGRITHEPGWESGARRMLMRLGIFTDAHRASLKKSGVPSPIGSAPTTQTAQPVQSINPAERSTIHLGLDSAPRGATFSMPSLGALVAKYPGAVVDDQRTIVGELAATGRLRVRDPLGNEELQRELMKRGFKWSDRWGAYYYPEY